MNNPKAFLITLIAASAATFAGAIGLLGVASNALGVVTILIILIATLVIMYLAYSDLIAIEDAEKQDEWERQQERDRVQLQILSTLRNLRDTGLRTYDPTDYLTQMETQKREQRLLKAIERIADHLDSPNIQHLIDPEGQQVETDVDDIPPEIDSAESQS